MTRRIDRELAGMERRLNALRLTSSERVEAMSAMRTGFLIVEGLAWLGRKLTRMGGFFLPHPTLQVGPRQG